MVHLDRLTVRLLSRLMTQLSNSNLFHTRHRDCIVTRITGSLHVTRSYRNLTTTTTLLSSRTVHINSSYIKITTLTNRPHRLDNFLRVNHTTHLFSLQITRRTARSRHMNSHLTTGMLRTSIRTRNASTFLYSTNTICQSRLYQILLLRLNSP